MVDRPDPTPEGALIARAVRQRHISARKIAPAAGITEARWRQIVNGYQSVGGQYIRVVAPAATLAKMARAVGITSDQLTDVGREDAAAVLADDLRDGSDSYTDPETGETYTDADEQALWDLNGLSMDTRRELIYYLRTKRAAQRHRPAS